MLWPLSTQAVSHASRDLTILIELPTITEATGGNQLLIQECTRPGGKKKTVGLATFVPRLPPVIEPSAGAQLSDPAPPLELILIIDGSGSMGGSPIQQALEAALFFVKDIPLTKAASVAFNVAVFGSSFSMMWPKSK